MVASYELPVARNYPTPTLLACGEGARLFARFAAIAIAKWSLRAKGVEVVTNVLRRFGNGLPLQYLLVSCQLRVASFQMIRGRFADRFCESCESAAVKQLLATTSSMEAVYRNSVTDFEGKRVTKWYVFRGETANDFEGSGLLSRMGKRRKTVSRTHDRGKRIFGGMAIRRFQMKHFSFGCF